MAGATMPGELAAKIDATLAGPFEAGNKAKEGGFSGAIGADKRGDTARSDGERGHVEDEPPTSPEEEVFHPDFH